MVGAHNNQVTWIIVTSVAVFVVHLHRDDSIKWIHFGPATYLTLATTFFKQPVANPAWMFQFLYRFQNIRPICIAFLAGLR